MKIRRKRSKRLFQTKLMAIFICLVMLVVFVDAQLRPVIKTIAGHQATTYATAAINNAVFDVIMQEELRYDHLVHLTSSESGNITALQIDMVSMNMLQSSITSQIIKEIMEFTDQTIKVPVGTLIGGQFFSGRGPSVEIKLIPASFVETSISNKFDSAGINQTRHQIFLNVKLTVSAVIPGYSVTGKVDTNILLAETVIVGLVPEAFTQVADGTEPLVGMIQDYDAGKRLDSLNGK